MNIISQNVISVLFVCGVFGADADGVKSVMEGDSVTLNTDHTEIHTYRHILWRFGFDIIAQITEGKLSYNDVPDGRFKDRLQLDNKTASLTITNMRMKHSGLYKLESVGKGESGTTYKEVSVNVYESPHDFVSGEVEIKSESMTEGYSLTLQTDVTETLRDELIVWRFGDEGKLIAKHDIEAKSSPLYYVDTDVRFRDRLKLDEKTGSLIITNTRNTDSGVYTVKISSNKQTLFKRFTVTISGSGLSSGAIAGFVFLLVFAAVVAAAGVIYYRQKISELQQLKVKTVLEGENLTLSPGTEIKSDDQTLWTSGNKDTPIAEAGESVMVDRQTRSLIITNTKTTDAGLYKLKIISGRRTTHQIFKVIVSERPKTVTEGESVTLNPHTAIQKDDLILWMFGDENKQTLIAEIKMKTKEIITYDYSAGGRFRDRLKLDENTGSLTFKNTRTTDTGEYLLQIISNSEVSYKTFSVTVSDKLEVKLLKGEDYVTLEPDAKIQKEDLFLWTFGAEDTLIAQIKGTGEIITYDDLDDDVGRFRGRLKLDNKTGSLTIKNITAEQIGLYKLQAIHNRGTSYKKFKVLMQMRYESVIEGQSLTLHTGLDKTETQTKVLWMFGDEKPPIATGTLNGKTRETHYDDGRFKDRLKLDETGSLTISDVTTKDAGHYILKIRSIDKNIHSTYIVIIRARGKSVTEGTNEKRVNVSATVVMPLLNGEDLNEQEGASSL